MAVHDPVCAMEIEPASAFATRQHMGQTYYLCSQSCAEKFDADPHRYAMQSRSATTGIAEDAQGPLRIARPVGGEEATDNFHGRLLPMLQEAGFYHASATEHRNTIFGPISFYSAAKIME